jgi:ABC-2 type transport system permease protein
MSLFKKCENTSILARFILRRDRVRTPVWIISIVSFTIMMALLIPNLYTVGADREIMAETMRNPAVTVMLGPGYGLDNYTDGAMMSHFMLLFTAVAVGIMSILYAIRHTREDEEAGRTEMIRSLPTGHLSNLTAVILVAVIMNMILFLAVGLGLYSLGFESMDFQGSMLYGAVLGATGIFFTALTCFFAQLSSNTRTVVGYSFGFLILAYFIRGIGDVGNEVLSLLSPLGLILRAQVYVNNYWWPVLLTIGISVICFGIALYLNSIRDLESGFISAKPGKMRASRLLASPLGLALRLLKSTIIAWTIGMFVLGTAYGSVLGDLEGFLTTSDAIKQMIPEVEGFSLTERFMTMLMMIMSILGAIPPLMYVLKLKAEEKSARTEQLHATAVSRSNIFGSYTLIGVAGTIIIQFVSIIGLWSSAKFVMDDPISLQMLLKAGFAHLPALWILVGLAVTLIGWAPKFTGLVWLYLGYSFFVGYLGEMLKLPDWMAKLSPFGHTPQIPVEEVTALPIILLTLIALILTAIGFVGYNRRDIEG